MTQDTKELIAASAVSALILCASLVLACVLSEVLL